MWTIRNTFIDIETGEIITYKEYKKHYTAVKNKVTKTYENGTNIKNITTSCRRNKWEQLELKFTVN